MLYDIVNIKQQRLTVFWWDSFQYSLLSASLLFILLIIFKIIHCSILIESDLTFSLTWAKYPLPLLLNHKTVQVVLYCARNENWLHIKGTGWMRDDKPLFIQSNWLVSTTSKYSYYYLEDFTWEDININKYHSPHLACTVQSALHLTLSVSVPVNSILWLILPSYMMEIDHAVRFYSEHSGQIYNSFFKMSRSNKYVSNTVSCNVYSLEGLNIQDTGVNMKYEILKGNAI